MIQRKEKHKQLYHSEKYLFPGPDCPRCAIVDHGYFSFPVRLEKVIRLGSLQDDAGFVDIKVYHPALVHVLNQNAKRPRICAESRPYALL